MHNTMLMKIMIMIMISFAGLLDPRLRQTNNVVHHSSIPSCTRFKCTRTFWYYCLMFVLTSKHEQSLRKGVTSTNKSTYIRSTYKRECASSLGPSTASCVVVSTCQICRWRYGYSVKVSVSAQVQVHRTGTGAANGYKLRVRVRI